VMGSQKVGYANKVSILVPETRDERDESDTSIETKVGHTPLHPSHSGTLCRFVGEITFGTVVMLILPQAIQWVDPGQK